jgi:hypothetical protein
MKWHLIMYYALGYNLCEETFLNSIKSWHEKLCKFLVSLQVHNFLILCWNDLEDIILNCKPRFKILRENDAISSQMMIIVNPFPTSIRIVTLHGFANQVG